MVPNPHTQIQSPQSLKTGQKDQPDPHKEPDPHHSNGQRVIQRGERVTLDQVESIARANSLPMTPAEE